MRPRTVAHLAVTDCPVVQSPSWRSRHLPRPPACPPALRREQSRAPQGQATYRCEPFRPHDWPQLWPTVGRNPQESPPNPPESDAAIGAPNRAESPVSVPDSGACRARPLERLRSGRSHVRITLGVLVNGCADAGALMPEARRDDALAACETALLPDALAAAPLEYMCPVACDALSTPAPSAKAGFCPSR